MTEIAALQWNGLTVASTFSGTGGSCLGYRWAGYRVVYANEFVEAARDCYAANFPDTFLDPADIRDVTGADLMARAGVNRGGLDLLDGSPPCQSFSTAGQREKGWGQSHAHADGSVQVSDDLFFEYARLLRDVQPRVFVAENVSGLVKGTAKGYFKLILAALKRAGYRVSARLLDAQWLGVPQSRQRIIFVGVRADLGVDPVFPKPLPYRYSVRDALPELDGVAADPETGSDLTPTPCRLVPGAYSERLLNPDEPVPTVLAGGSNDVLMPLDVRRDPETGTVVDLGDYAIGRDWDYLAAGGNPAGRRYQSSVLALPDRPSPTVTSGSSGGTAGVMHPVDRRKFTIAELRRICGFPDDFILTGTYAQRWARLGNAVPPPMARAVSAEIADRILLPRQ